MSFSRSTFFAAVIAVVLMPLSAAAVSAPSPITYRVTLANPEKRTLHVECDLAEAKKGTVRFTFPSWSPGIYTFRPISRYILNLKVSDGQRQLAVTEVPFDTYEVANDNSTALRIEYDIDLSETNRNIDKSFIGDEVALI